MQKNEVKNKSTQIDIDFFGFLEKGGYFRVKNGMILQKIGWLWEEKVFIGVEMGKGVHCAITKIEPVLLLPYCVVKTTLFSA